MQKQAYEFISQKYDNPIVERRTCRWTGEQFPVFQSEVDLLERISPVIAGKKFSYPLPTLSPQARKMRMMLFRNERKLYRRKDTVTGKPIVSLYHASFPGKVCSPQVRWSDQWDALDYGVDYQPGKFYSQLHELLRAVPLINLFSVNNVNSDYVNGAQENKDCYMIFASDYNEQCYYAYSIQQGKYVVDCYGCNYCEHAYECIDCQQSSQLFFSDYIERSHNIYMSSHLIGCEHCLGCTGLQNKQYYVYNQEIGKKKWEGEIQPMLKRLLGDRELIAVELQKLATRKQQVIYQHMNIINAEKAIGDAIIDSKNILDCYELSAGEDISGVINCSDGCKDVMGAYVIVDGSQKVHEGISIISNYSSGTVWNSRDTVQDAYFSAYIATTKYVLGCIGTQQQQYCILNKQYSQEEREKLALQIVSELQEQGRRGELFDPSFSPFPFNDTVAIEYYPPEKIIYPDGRKVVYDAQGQGTVTLLQDDKFIVQAELDLGGEKIATTWRTQEQEITVPQEMEVVDADTLAVRITDVDEGILTQAIRCSESGRLYRIVKQELAFYRQHGLPLPRQHPDLRHQKRVAKRPGRNLYMRNCASCGEEMVSVYGSKNLDSRHQNQENDQKKVYCEVCYRRDIYG